MPTCIPFVAPDGTVRIVVPVEPALPGESEAAYLSRVGDRAVQRDASLADCTRLSPMDAAALPATRRWRNQWRVAAGAIAPSVPLCRGARLAELRADRNARLAASDGPALRANEQGTAEQQAAWRAYRQALRDLPATAQTALTGCETPDAVAEYSPTWPTAPT